QALVLTLRGADDPHCVALYGGPRSTCFTILWRPGYPKHFSDPGVRGSARIVDDKLVLGFDLVPFDQPCEGTSSTYAISGDRSTLTGIDWPACSFSGFTAPCPAVADGLREFHHASLRFDARPHRRRHRPR